MISQLQCACVADSSSMFCILQRGAASHRRAPAGAGVGMPLVIAHCATASDDCCSCCLRLLVLLVSLSGTVSNSTCQKYSSFDSQWHHHTICDDVGHFEGRVEDTSGVFFLGCCHRCHKEASRGVFGACQQHNLVANLDGVCPHSLKWANCGYVQQESGQSCWYFCTRMMLITQYLTQSAAASKQQTARGERHNPAPPHVQKPCLYLTTGSVLYCWRYSHAFTLAAVLWSGMSDVSLMTRWFLVTLMLPADLSARVKVRR